MLTFYLTDIMRQVNFLKQIYMHSMLCSFFSNRICINNLIKRRQDIPKYLIYWFCKGTPLFIIFVSCDCFQMKIDHAWRKLSWTFSILFSISIALLSKIIVFLLTNRQNMHCKHLETNFRFSPYLDFFFK